MPVGTISDLVLAHFQSHLRLARTPLVPSSSSSEFAVSTILENPATCARRKLGHRGVGYCALFSLRCEGSVSISVLRSR